MNQGHRTLKDRMVERLATSTGWLTSADLSAGLSTNRLAIEDAIADLVVEQTADYKPASGYRLKGTVLCRQALRTLKAQGGQRAVVGAPFKAVYRVGVAEVLDGGVGGVVLYELELPMPPAGPEHLQQHLLQAEQILKFTHRGNANV